MLELAAATQLPREQLAALLRRNPSILEAPTYAWQANMGSLQTELGLTLPQAQAVVCSHPRLLRLEPLQLQRACRQLGRMLRQREGWLDEFAELPPAKVGAGSACSAFCHDTAGCLRLTCPGFADLLACIQSCAPCCAGPPTHTQSAPLG